VARLRIMNNPRMVSGRITAMRGSGLTKPRLTSGSINLVKL